jgi:signal transduction histidine kinase
MDDGIGMAMDGAAGRDPNQLGLIGMRERVMAMAGSLSIQPGRDGTGLVLAARLPDARSPRFQNEGGAE